MEVAEGALMGKACTPHSYVQPKRVQDSWQVEGVATGESGRRGCGWTPCYGHPALTLVLPQQPLPRLHLLAQSFHLPLSRFLDASMGRVKDGDQGAQEWVVAWRAAGLRV